MNLRSSTTGTLWRPSRALRGMALFALVCLVFLLVMRQDPLYSDNQTTKFLHGMAWAGAGDLRHDWLAGTKDGLPLFSGLVYAIFAWLPPFMVYVLFAGLVGVCFFSLEGILRHTFGIAAGGRRHAWLCASLIIILACFHTWYDGVAAQYLLGDYLQPCVFGVFIFLSVRWFLERKEGAASAALALAYLMHPAYLFLAVVLIAAYLFELRRDGREARAYLTTLGPFLVCIAAYVLYLGMVFRPTSPQAFAQATRILAVERIPYHSLISNWAGPSAYGKLVLVLIAIRLLRGRPLARLLAWLTAATLLLTLVQGATHSNALALVAPWRASVVIVPLALFAVIARLLLQVPEADRAMAGKRLVTVFTLLLLVLVARGLRSNLKEYRAYHAGPEMAVLRYIKAHRQPGDVYCIPVRDAAFEKFRLETGAPAFVNWKSHPYKDVEVLEWDARIALAQRLGKATPADLPTVLEALRAHDHVTHIVVRQPAPWPDAPGLVQAFADPAFVLYRIVPR
ncbi:MAG TPA: DUF6798 domain-containing protein [Holophaga sp.]|nr:DUF6798 domain-containing protein [Holophaga sp.]